MPIFDDAIDAGAEAFVNSAPETPDKRWWIHLPPDEQAALRHRFVFALQAYYRALVEVAEGKLRSPENTG
jgi:hypothetical protein